MENTYYVTAIPYSNPDKRIRIVSWPLNYQEAEKYLKFCNDSKYFYSHFKDPRVELIT